jgi:hypothetical protein
MAKNADKLPKKLFITRENPGTDDEYLGVNQELSEIIVETGKRQLVGEYELKRQVEVITETTIVTEVG